jgi:hypothetical protein
MPLSLPSAFEKRHSSTKKFSRFVQVFFKKLKINLEDKLTTYTFALPIKKRAFFQRRKWEESLEKFG